MAIPTTSPQIAVPVGMTMLLSFTPFGVSFETLMLGGACFFAGCAARTGISLYKKLDGPSDVSAKDFMRAVAMLLCCTPLAAVASCVVFLAAHVAKVEADAALGGLLLVMGVRGPEGFQWLMDNLASIFTRWLPTGGKPGGGT